MFIVFVPFHKPSPFTKKLPNKLAASHRDWLVSRHQSKAGVPLGLTIVNIIGHFFGSLEVPLTPRASRFGVSAMEMLVCTLQWNHWRLQWKFRARCYRRQQHSDKRCIFWVFLTKVISFLNTFTNGLVYICRLRSIVHLTNPSLSYVRSLYTTFSMTKKLLTRPDPQLSACETEHAGLTQVQVSKKLKCSQLHISKAESGERRIDIIELKKFAKIYKKSIDYFVK